jgi:hypothetical protein
VARSDGNFVEVRYGAGWKESLTLAATHPSTVAAGDLDGDGKLDLVVAEPDLNDLVVFRNTTP